MLSIGPTAAVRNPADLPPTTVAGRDAIATATTPTSRPPTDLCLRHSVVARTRRLLDRPGMPVTSASQPERRERSRLTAGEREVLALLVEGERTDAIAQRLCITRKTASMRLDRRGSMRICNVGSSYSERIMAIVSSAPG